MSLGLAQTTGCLLLISVNKPRNAELLGLIQIELLSIHNYTADISNSLAEAVLLISLPQCLLNNSLRHHGTVC